MKKGTIKEDVETELYLTINEIINGGKDLPKGYNVSRGQAIDYAFDIAVKISKWQAERMYSQAEVIKIVEKSRETGLTAEFLLLTEQFKKK